jgi:hypothetical protein
LLSVASQRFACSAKVVINVSHEWVEVNILPSSPDQRERLLLDVIDQLIHEKLSGRMEIWIYFWESDPPPLHLRLRIRWQRPEQSNEYRGELFALLNAAKSGDQLADWYEGNHGVRDEVYQGEDDAYGAEVWEAISRDWMSGSELALTLVKLESNGQLTQSLQFHWERRVHLFSNQLGFNLQDEVYLSLRQARGYLPRLSTTDRGIIDSIKVIERIQAYLASIVRPSLRG